MSDSDERRTPSKGEVPSRRGVYDWHDEEDLHKAHGRWRSVAAGLLLVSAFWIFAGVVGAESVGEFLSINAFLQAITLPPAVYAIRRARRLSRMITQSREAPGSVVEGDAPVPEEADHGGRAQVDEIVNRIGRLVDRLPETLRRSAGAEAFTSASRTAAQWRTLVERRADLHALERAAGDRPGQADLAARITAIDAEADALARSMDSLAVAMADLADRADDHDLDEVSSRVRDSEQHVRLLASALDEIDRGDSAPRRPTAD